MYLSFLVSFEFFLHYKSNTTFHYRMFGNQKFKKIIVSGPSTQR